VTSRVAEFTEVQRFRRWWFALLLAVPLAVSWWGFVVQILLGRDWGSKPAPDFVVWILWLVFGIAFPWWLWTLAVVTVVDGDGVHVRWNAFPVRRTFPFEDIVEHTAVTYRPLRDFGGWGWRRGREGRIGYTVRGVEGVELHLSGDRRVLIGSQRAGELASVISLHR
jgi:hypothetical protein